jgi:hypothetical protein
MAALASEDARTVYAQIVLGARHADLLPGVKEQRRTKALRVLHDAGLVEQASNGELKASSTVFRDLLSQQPRQPKTGVARFIRLGRIDRYPASAAERRELLAWVANEAVRPEEILTERQVNERLLSYTDDVVLLRRYLVDYGLLERTLSGSSYARPAGSSKNQPQPDPPDPTT